MDSVADSSFYICFMDDIDSVDELITILDNFSFHLSPLIESEIKKSKNYDSIRGHKNINLFETPSFQIGELVKPFFSRDQVVKGEHEVIVVAYFVYNLKKELILIIDEEGPRKYVERNFPYLKPFMTGTVGMIRQCYAKHQVFKRDTAIEILEKIRKSKFRIDEKTINSTISQLRAS